MLSISHLISRILDDFRYFSLYSRCYSHPRFGEQYGDVTVFTLDSLQETSQCRQCGPWMLATQSLGSSLEPGVDVMFRVERECNGETQVLIAEYWETFGTGNLQGSAFNVQET